MTRDQSIVPAAASGIASMRLGMWLLPTRRAPGFASAIYLSLGLLLGSVWLAVD